MGASETPNRNYFIILCSLIIGVNSAIIIALWGMAYLPHQRIHTADNPIFLALFFSLPNLLFMACFLWSRQNLCKDCNLKHYKYFLALSLGTPLLGIILPWIIFLGDFSKEFKSGAAVVFVVVSVPIILIAASIAWIVMTAGRATLAAAPGDAPGATPATHGIHTFIVEELECKPGSILCLLLIFFLILIDSSSFAFALHDQSRGENEYGLLMPKINLQKKDPSPNSTPGAEDGKSKPDEKGPPSEPEGSPDDAVAGEKGSDADQENIWVFYYKNLDYSLQLDSDWNGKQTRSEFRTNLDNMIKKSTADLDFERLWHNTNQFFLLKQTIERHNQSNTILSLIVNGYASPERVNNSPAISDNYQLSGARAGSFHALLEEYKRKTKPAAEILITPFTQSSNEYRLKRTEDLIDAYAMEIRKDDTNKNQYDLLRRVEVTLSVNNMTSEAISSSKLNKLIEAAKDNTDTLTKCSSKMDTLEKTFAVTEPADLLLLDYIYFTVYTISTTGYGDIIPQSQFSKFFCSLLNIYEVIFLVMIINAFLAFANIKHT